MYLNPKMNPSIAVYSNKIQRAAQWIEDCDVIIVGAGSGLSSSAGFDYAGERFEKYLGDFGRRYGYHDMYSGGFYPYESSERYWAYWSRFIYINRYMDPPIPVYQNVLDLIKNKEYFVLTTNVDHMFQRSGFDQRHLFYTQGDYGLFQSRDPRNQTTWDNRADIEAMLKDQGFSFDERGRLIPSLNASMDISTDLIPADPIYGGAVRPNLREDHLFVEDEGWHAAAERYAHFLSEARTKRVVFLELGVGYNTPGIIKYPFQQMTRQFPQAKLISIGIDTGPAPIRDKSISIEADINQVILDILNILNS